MSGTLLLVVKRLYSPTRFVQLPLNFLGRVGKILGATVSAKTVILSLSHLQYDRQYVKQYVRQHVRR